MKKTMHVFFIILCLLFVPFIIDYQMYVKASPKTWIVDDDGPADFNTIQQAINTASSGHNIFVHNGVYYENVIINKSLSITGENRDFTIIDGKGTNNVVSIKADSVTVKNFTIRNSGRYTYSGVRVEQYGDNVIADNKIIDNYEGISVLFSNNNVISDNNISDNFEGITFFQSGYNKVSDNIVFLNGYDGIYLYSSNNNSISRNLIQDNIDGISVLFSNNNVFSGNTILNNYQGISLTLLSSSNTIFGNNLNNTIQAVSDSWNFWNNTGEGNYWSNYNGIDNNGDGIGDYPYVIDEDDQDNYPLMGIFSSFDVEKETKTYSVTIISNSTISDFEFEIGQETGNKIIHYNVTGLHASLGFSRITIPTELMAYPYIIIIDGTKITPTPLNVSKATTVRLYFTYPHKNSTVRIISSETMHLYYELFARYSELQGDINDLNETLYNLLNDYGILLGNHNDLLESLNALNASYQKHLSDYSAQLENMRNLMYIVAATAAILMVTTVYSARNTHAKILSKTQVIEEE